MRGFEPIEPLPIQPFEPIQRKNHVENERLLNRY